MDANKPEPKVDCPELPEHLRWKGKGDPPAHWYAADGTRAIGRTRIIAMTDPTAPTSLLSLGERVEKAMGPDRELDCAIRLAVYAPDGATMEQSTINGAWCIYSGTSFRTGKPSLWESNAGREMAFTASIDAAMTLVPEGWRTAMASELEHREGWLWRLGQKVGTGRFGAAGIDGYGTSAALALCSAALKARASMV